MTDELHLLREGRAFGVAALLLAVDDALQGRLGAVTVRGELAGVTRAASGHVYFTLKDDEGAAAALRCAMFRRAAALLPTPPRDGQHVQVRGRLSVYAARGELQMVVEALQPLGDGAWYERFLLLKAKLERQGLFDPARRIAPPTFPRTLALVTSSAGAALHDVVTTLARRAPHVQVVLFPTPVQGTAAPAAIVDALAAADAWPDVDLVLLCRGGGSLEDLWAFNDERVVRAVDAMRRPIVVGVGHETDVTLADLAADVRAPTPTAAAELATPRRDDLAGGLDAIDAALRRAVAVRIDRDAHHLDRLGFALAAPAQRVEQAAQRLDTLARRVLTAVDRGATAAAVRVDALAPRLAQAPASRLQHETRALDGLRQRLAALDPDAVLARGYVWLECAQGAPLTRVAQLRPGQLVQAHLADGRARLEVRAAQPSLPLDDA